MIFPLVNFGMAVAKGKACGFNVACGRIIHDLLGSVGRTSPTVCLHDKKSVIDGVFALVEQDECGRRRSQVGEPERNIERRADIPAAQRTVVAADEVFHRIAAGAGHKLTLRVLAH